MKRVSQKMKSTEPVRRPRWSLRVRALPGILLAVAVLAQAAPPPAKPAPHKDCDGLGDASFFHDEGINIKVASKLKFSKALMRETIQTRTNGGIVMLYGNVATPEHARLAEKLASEVGGVRCVKNNLVVGPPSSPPVTNPY